MMEVVRFDRLARPCRVCVYACLCAWCVVFACAYWTRVQCRTCYTYTHIYYTYRHIRRTLPDYMHALCAKASIKVISHENILNSFASKFVASCVCNSSTVQCTSVCRYLCIYCWLSHFARDRHAVQGASFSSVCPPNHRVDSKPYASCIQFEHRLTPISVIFLPIDIKTRGAVICGRRSGSGRTCGRPGRVLNCGAQRWPSFSGQCARAHR